MNFEDTTKKDTIKYLREADENIQKSTEEIINEIHKKLKQMQKEVSVLQSEMKKQLTSAKM